MSASRPTAVADPQAMVGGGAANEELASRLRVAVTRLNRKLRQQLGCHRLRPRPSVP